MEGYDPISLETMPVNKWLSANIAILFRNQTYLLNRFQADEILSENGHVECSTEEYGNKPMLETYRDGRYVYGTYYDFKDIGIPGVVCEEAIWNSVVMRDLHETRFVIKEDEEYPTIRITPIDEDKCSNSRDVTMGIISPLTVVSGGKKRKTKRRHNKKKSNKKY